MYVLSYNHKSSIITVLNSDLNSMVPIDKPKTSADGAEMVLSMALIPAGFKRPNGTFLIDV